MNRPYSIELCDNAYRDLWSIFMRILFFIGFSLHFFFQLEIEDKSIKMIPLAYGSGAQPFLFPPLQQGPKTSSPLKANLSCFSVIN